MKTFISIPLIIIVIAMTFSLVACENEGPAEKAGKKVDQAIEQTKEQIDKAAEEAKKKAGMVKEKAEEEVRY